MELKCKHCNETWNLPESVDFEMLAEFGLLRMREDYFGVIERLKNVEGVIPNL
jgi:hypothetical protein